MACFAFWKHGSLGPCPCALKSREPDRLLREASHRSWCPFCMHRRNTHTDGEFSPSPSMGTNCYKEPFSHLQGALLGCVGQDNYKLFSAISRYHISGSHILRQYAGDSFQGLVSGRVSILIVVVFEMVNIDHQERYGPIHTAHELAQTKAIPHLSSLQSRHALILGADGSL